MAILHENYAEIITQERIKIENALHKLTIKEVHKAAELMDDYTLVIDEVPTETIQDLQKILDSLIDREDDDANIAINMNVEYWADDDIVKYYISSIGWREEINIKCVPFENLIRESYSRMTP